MAKWSRFGAFFIFLLTCVEGQDADKSRCPSLSLTYKMTTRGETCYQFYYGRKTWKEARGYCNQHGGHLITINDPATFTYIKNTLDTMSWNEEEFWIGLTDINDELVWKWVQNDGERDIDMTWSNWHEDHPQGWFHSYRDCIKMKKDDGDWTWHEVTCNTYPWVYRFICEYQAAQDSGNYHQNGAGGHIQTAASTNRPRTTLDDISTLGNGAEHSNHGSTGLIGGEHRKVTDSERYLPGSQDGLSAEGDPFAAETKEDDEGGDVPLYAVIISFGAGVVFACGIILFIVFRRRKRKKAHEDTYPSVIYRAQPAIEGGMAAGGVGAVGLPVVCGLTGKSCKMAVSTGTQKCTCEEEHETFVSGPGRSRKPCTGSNVYVSDGNIADSRGAVGGISADPISGFSEASQSVASSMRDICSLDEQPPTYDEACAGIVEAEVQNDRCENVYTHEPHNTVASDRALEPHQLSEAHSPSSLDGTVTQGAIPKRTPPAAYLPMNGSPKLNEGTTTTNTYVPMSLGELPPIPTDEGYEIPVSSKLEPEAVKSISFPGEETHAAGNRMSSIYSEIPDRNSRFYRHNEEEIYQTID